MVVSFWWRFFANNEEGVPSKKSRPKEAPRVGKEQSIQSSASAEDNKMVELTRNVVDKNNMLSFGLSSNIVMGHMATPSEHPNPH